MLGKCCRSPEQPLCVTMHGDDGQIRESVCGHCQSQPGMESSQPGLDYISWLIFLQFPGWK